MTCQKCKALEAELERQRAAVTALVEACNAALANRVTLSAWGGCDPLRMQIELAIAMAEGKDA